MADKSKAKKEILKKLKLKDLRIPASVKKGVGFAAALARKKAKIGLSKNIDLELDAKKKKAAITFKKRF